jgi:hypothetical protein
MDERENVDQAYTDSVKRALQELPDRTFEAGDYSMLRVLASYPAQPSMPEAIPGTGPIALLHIDKICPVGTLEHLNSMVDRRLKSSASERKAKTARLRDEEDPPPSSSKRSKPSAFVLPKP